MNSPTSRGSRRWAALFRRGLTDGDTLLFLAYAPHCCTYPGDSICREKGGKETSLGGVPRLHEDPVSRDLSAPLGADWSYAGEMHLEGAT